MNQVLILGSRGMLGGQLMKVFKDSAVGWDKDDVDITNVPKLKAKILNLKPLPGTVINCVAYNNVDGAEANPEMAFALNEEAVKQLAKICNELTIPLVHFSSNYVFDGQKGEYSETDEPHPLSVYGKSKYEGEKQLISHTQQYYLIRTSVLFGPKGQSEQSKKSFVEKMVELSATQSEIEAVVDEINSLTYAADLAKAVQVLLSQKFAFGIYHFANLGQASWFEFATEIFKLIGKNVELKPVLSSKFVRPAERPKKAVLLNTKFIPFRPWQEALAEYLRS